MRHSVVTTVAVAVLLALGCASRAQAQADFDVWADPTFPPPLDQIAFLPIPIDEEGGDEYVHVGDQTEEKDGQTYKTVQFYRDTAVEATAQVGQYVLGYLGNFWPKGTVDGVALLKATRLVAVEIDDAVFPLDESNISFLPDFPFEGVDLVAYGFYPRFQQPGSYTLRYRWRQVEPFHLVWPFGIDPNWDGAVNSPAEDPLGLEGRRVLMAEQEGDPVDGDMLLTYHLTVVKAPLVVSPESWGMIKQKHTVTE